MLEIKLTNSKRRVALIDDEDYELVSRYNWNVGDNQVIYKDLVMARLIMKAQPGQDVDHINRDGLDNRKVNLRLATHQQNYFNKRGKKSSSGFIGVTRHSPSGKWRADISIDYKTKYIGLFATPEEAALARDDVARELHGEFAMLNFPDEKITS